MALTAPFSTQPIYTDASAILRDAAHLRGYHVAEPADVSSEQYLGSFACVIEAIVSVIKVWSSRHVHSGIRQMCVVFDSDAAVFQCRLVCRENDIPEPRQWRFTERKEVLPSLYMRYVWPRRGWLLLGHADAMTS